MLRRRLRANALFEIIRFSFRIPIPSNLEMDVRGHYPPRSEGNIFTEKPYDANKPMSYVTSTNASLSQPLLTSASETLVEVPPGRVLTMKKSVEAPLQIKKGDIQNR